MSTLKENLIEILNSLANKGITNSRILTEDGIIIASNDTGNQINNDNSKDMGAISASIMSIAEKGVEILNKNVILEQIKIDVGIDENIEKDYTIIIERISQNLLLQVLFPKRINIGIVHFETNKAINDIKKITNDKKINELLLGIV